MNKEIELLNNKLDAQDKIINTQALEIAKLKEQLENDIDNPDTIKVGDKLKIPMNVVLIEKVGEKENE